MAKWHFVQAAFGSQTALDFFLDLNPATDTGWLHVPILVEQHVIGGTNTVLQIGGMKSRERVIEGVTQSKNVRTNLGNIFARRRLFDITDHRGQTETCFMTELKLPQVMDASTVTTDVLTGTWRYTVKLLRRPIT